MQFDGTQKTIGTGAQAEVVLYHGYAYKIYKPSYPAEWIAFEKSQQKAVNEAGLCHVRYYDTDDEHIIKMDLVEGETLETRARNGDPSCFSILGQAFRFVHEKDISGIAIPRFIDTAGLQLNEQEKDIVLPIIEDLSSRMESRVCHLDMHFLNIMVPQGKNDFTIIDWINARIAPPVFDYARTYVIFNEFSKDGAALYEQLILPQMWETGITDRDFQDAVTAGTILRNHEK